MDVVVRRPRHELPQPECVDGLVEPPLVHIADDIEVQVQVTGDDDWTAVSRQLLENNSTARQRTGCRQRHHQADKRPRRRVMNWRTPSSSKVVGVNENLSRLEDRPSLLEKNETTASLLPQADGTAGARHV